LTQSRGRIKVAGMKYPFGLVVLALVSACGGGSGGTGAPAPPPQGAPFGLEARPSVMAVNLPNQAPQPGSFSLVEAFPNLSFTAAIYIAGVPGDGRLVVAEQGGRVYAFVPSATVANGQRRLVLDLSGQVLFVGDERGLLGLTFDPDFVTNRYLYVHYSVSGSGDSRISRFTWDAGTDSVNLASEKQILNLAQPAANHNGGALAFGGDGYLYIAFGDGGGANDQFGNGQNLGTLLGALLRINVHPQNPTDPYDIPVDNPFVARAGARPEIWAFGLRNPFRFSFDRQNGDLWLGDVGQSAREEVDLVSAGGNYGWGRFEGTQLFNSSVALASGTTHSPPVLDYPRNVGTTVIGGYVYRGSRFASLFGRYLYADYGAGSVWALTWDGNQVTSNDLLDTASNPTSLGEANDGEVFVVQQNGSILEFAESGGGGSVPNLLSATGLFTDLNGLIPASGLIEYDLNQAFWSDGALKRRWLRIPANERIQFSATGAWDFPVGTIFVKHFELELTEGNPSSARRLETRVLVRGSNQWFGFTYRWNTQETDADLLAGRESELITVQVPGVGPRQQQYDYPSRTDCLQCHTNAAGSALGVRTQQLNRDFAFPLASDNQLRTYNHVGLFSTDIGAATQYRNYAALDDLSASITARARAYLDVNCAQCHQPGGGTGVAMDLRFDTAANAMGAIGVAPQTGDLGIANARIVDAGSKETSVLWQRMQRLDGNRMPPIASHRTDDAGVAVVGDWIDTLP
jgi:uncharacterized repeat protein (TIGR03806 family)